MNIQKIIERLQVRQRNSRKFWELTQEIIKRIPCEGIRCYADKEFRGEFYSYQNGGYIKKQVGFYFGIENKEMVICYLDNSWDIERFLDNVEYFNFKDAVKSFLSLLENLGEIYTGTDDIEKLDKRVRV